MHCRTLQTETFYQKQRLSKALIFLKRQLKIHFLHFYQQLLQFLQFVRSQIFDYFTE